MAKKKEAAEPEPTEAPAEKMTQREAVEKALEAGKELPADGVPYVLKEFGITLSNQAYSTIKSKIRNGGKKAPRAEAAPAAARTTAPAAPAGGLALHIEAIKTLVDTLGVDEVVSIARLFAK